MRVLYLPFFLAFFTLSTTVIAIEVEQGVVYSAGTLIESSEVGAAFTVPEGWQGVWPNGSQFFILESQALQANLFLMFDAINEQQLMTLMSGNIPLDNGIALQPLSTPKKNQHLIEAQYRVVGIPHITDAFVAGRELRSGLSVAIIALAQTSDTKVNQTTSSIVRDMESIEVKVDTTRAPDNNHGAQSWQNYMRGRYIARYYTGSDYHEKQELWLCSDGTFFSSFNSGGYSMNGASGAFQSGGQGHWKAEGHTTGSGSLTLQFGAGKKIEGNTPGFDWTETSAGGERRTYRLTLGDKLYLDNKQWLRGNNEYCE